MKNKLKKEFIKWCDEPVSANGNDREEMFEKIWQEATKEEKERIIKMDYFRWQLREDLTGKYHIIGMICWFLLVIFSSDIHFQLIGIAGLIFLGFLFLENN